jgi:nucleotide-binding universal stress UspA family protein
MQRILLATERTEFDVGAERVAIALAQKLKTDLRVVLPLASNPEYLGAEPDIALQAEQQAAAALSALREQARSDGVVARTNVRRGDVLWREIVDAAGAERADLLITRRVGRRGLFARLLVGEMVSQVAAHAPCPVLMVPSSASGLWSKRVLMHPLLRSAHVESLALALAAVGGARLEMFESAADLLAAHAGPDDLIVSELGAAHVSAGRVAKEIELLIGSAVCPAVLVRTAAQAVAA